MSESPVTLGEQLYRDVESYAVHSTHRTGTDDDVATIEWFRSILQADGANVVVEGWDFPQWTGEWQAELDGEMIDSLPIFYETSGSFDSAHIDVVATPHPGGLLTVKNRRPLAEVPVRERATLQVAGEHEARRHEIRAHIGGARVVHGRSANVYATYGSHSRDVELLIATPLSGWFNCASERGTGIAIARWLALALVQGGVRVGLLGTSGHELFNVGLERYLARPTTKPAAVIHVGASVAARAHPSAADAPPTLSDSLYVITNRADGGYNLESAGFNRRIGGADPKQWIGEGTRWCTQGAPLLSVAGVSHWFHTPHDTPERATHPALLETVAGALLNEARQLLHTIA
jgi:hypothetical protein